MERDALGRFAGAGAMLRRGRNARRQSILDKYASRPETMGAARDCCREWTANAIAKGDPWRPTLPLIQVANGVALSIEPWDPDARRMIDALTK